ncbi:MAG: hypothetical protein QF534_09100 [Phycisphaerales bacterium]|jgi:hypothetical protein|nr:hypothetical protein [Phycisphaerales bacterium]
MTKSLLNGLLVVFACTAWAEAAHQYMNFPELVHTSQAIVDARVGESVTWQDEHGVIHTEITFEVIDLVHADPVATSFVGDEFILPLPGGTVGEVTMTVGGLPRFQEGERVLLFTMLDGERYWNPVLGGDQGVFRIREQGPSAPALPMRASGRGIVEISGNRIQHSPIVDRFEGSIAVFEPIEGMMPPSTSADGDLPPTVRAVPERGTLMTLATFKDLIHKELQNDSDEWDITVRLSNVKPVNPASQDDSASSQLDVRVPAGVPNARQVKGPPSWALDPNGTYGSERGGSSLCICGSQDLFINMEMVPEAWWNWNEDNWALWCWNQWMDIYRILDDDGTFGPNNGENEFGGFPSNTDLSDAGYSYTWGAGTLGVTTLWVGSLCNSGSINEADVFFNPAYSWSDNFDDWFQANLSPAPYQPTTIHEIGHVFGFMVGLSDGTGCAAETYDYSKLSVMHAVYQGIVETGRGIQGSDAWAIRNSYDDQTSIISLVDIGCESYYSNSGTLTNSTTDASRYHAGDSMTFENVSVESMSSSATSNVRIRFYLSENQNITTSDYQCGGYNQWGSFSAEGWSLGDYTKTIPSNIPPGTYWPGMIVTHDGDNYTSDGHGFNNATFFASQIDIRPDNDLCSNAEVVTSGSSYSFTNNGGSTDGYPHLDCGNSGNTAYNDIWFEYTPTCDGTVTVDTCDDTDFDTILAFYEDDGVCPPNDSEELACNDDSCSVQSSISADVQAGQTYLIRLGSFSESTTGTGTLTISQTDSVENDTCENAISRGNGTWNVDTTCAQSDGPTDITCGHDTIFKDVWYEYTAACTGTFHVNTCGVGGVDTVIAVYDNTSGCGGTMLDCNDQSPTCSSYPNTSTVNVPVSQGQSLLVRVGGWTENNFGSVQVTFHLYEGAANDDCSDAETIASGSHDFDTRCADTDGVLHSDCQWDGQTYNDLWYRWTAPCTGELTVSTCDIADYDTDLVVYHDSGSCPPDDSDLLACNDDGPGCGGYTSHLTATVFEGQTFLIRVGGYNSSDEGTGTVLIDCEEQCVGDINGDGTTGVDDLLAVIAVYGTTDPSGDVDGNGVVDVADLLLVIDAWGPCV